MEHEGDAGTNNNLCTWNGTIPRGLVKGREEFEIRERI